ncbi:multidrug efflux SMR transporter [Pontibacterium sp.]|uniref:DMT family transporter n=1 Tax=Pontibacterium sp. TaxID=2036026 RepID=UPI003515C70B
MTGWSLLMLGIVFEVAGTFCLKLSNGFSNITASVLCFAFFAVALSLITLSAKTLDVSIVYAVWSGVGIVLITLLGVLFFQEAISPGRIGFIVLILVGVLGLHHESNPEQPETEHVHTSQQ